MNGPRDTTIMNIIFGNDEDTASAVVQCHLDIIPRVGEIVGSTTQRDAYGNYLNDGKPIWDARTFRDLGTGIVTRVEHTIEEGGRNSREHYWRHFINIYVNASSAPSEPSVEDK